MPAETKKKAETKVKMTDEQRKSARLLHTELNAGCPLTFLNCYEPVRVMRLISSRPHVAGIRNVWSWTIVNGISTPPGIDASANENRDPDYDPSEDQEQKDLKARKTRNERAIQEKSREIRNAEGETADTYRPAITPALGTRVTNRRQAERSGSLQASIARELERERTNEDGDRVHIGGSMGGATPVRPATLKRMKEDLDALELEAEAIAVEGAFRPPEDADAFLNDAAAAVKWTMSGHGNILFIPDYWALKDNSEFISAINEYCGEFGPAKSRGNMVVIIGVDVQASMHPTMKNDAVLLEVSLPSVEMLEATVAKVAKYADIVKDVDDKKKHELADELHGLSNSQAETVLARSYAATGALGIEFVRDETRKVVEQIGPLKVVHPSFSFKDVGGFAAAKEYMMVLASDNLPPELAAKMILFLGVPGAGKSMVAQAAAHELGWKYIEFDVGAAMNKWVGESERTMREALAYLSTASRCVIIMDEIEKMYAGAGTESSGVTTRMLGTFLTWNQNRNNRALLLATANGIDGLPPEMFRAGRVDKVYFVGEPDPEQMKSIIKLKKKKYKIPDTEKWPTMHGWTGAEVEQLALEWARYQTAAKTSGKVQQRSLIDLSAGIMPVTRKMGVKMDQLKTFAAHSCTCAHKGTPYQYSREPAPPPPSA